MKQRPISTKIICVIPMISILDQKIHLVRSTRLSNKVVVVVVVVVVVAAAAVAVVAFTFNDFPICPRWIMGNK